MVVLATHEGGAPVSPRGSHPAAVDRQESYQAHYEHSPDGLFSLKVLGPNQFIFEGLNRAHERATGLINDQVIGLQPQDFLDPVTGLAAHLP